MIPSRRLLTGLALCAALGCASAPSSRPTSETQAAASASKPAQGTPGAAADSRSLFDRLGGMPAIEAVVADFQQNVAADERMLKEPAPVVALGSLGQSSVDLIVRPWVKSSDYWSVLWDTNEAVKLKFDEAGISIPFPQMDVHFDVPEPRAAE